MSSPAELLYLEKGQPKLNSLSFSTKQTVDNSLKIILEKHLLIEKTKISCSKPGSKLR